MPRYTVHIKVETDVDIAATDRAEAIELAGQLELNRFISPANATVVAVMEDPAAEIPDESSARGSAEGSGEGSGEGDAE